MGQTVKMSAIQHEFAVPNATGGGLRGLRRRRGISGMPITIRLLLIIAFCLVPTIGLQVAVSWSQWAERKTQVGDLAARQAACWGAMWRASARVRGCC